MFKYSGSGFPSFRNRKTARVASYAHMGAGDDDDDDVEEEDGVEEEEEGEEEADARDIHSAAADVGMQGRGRFATIDERTGVVDAIKTAVEHHNASLGVSWAQRGAAEHLSAGDENLKIWIHTYAVIHGRETVRSAAHPHSRTRDSSHVLVRFNPRRHRRRRRRPTSSIFLTFFVLVGGLQATHWGW
jgi:hypothetical protein